MLWRALSGALTALAVILAVGPATAQDGCSVPAASSWTQTEAMVWDQLCAGGWADLNGTDDDLDPKQPEGWDDRWVLSSRFVEQLLAEPYAAVIDRHGIRLRGVWFPGGLDVSEAFVSFPLRCHNCRITRLQADGMMIDGTLDLGGSSFRADISLRDADIRGNLEVDSGSRVSGTLTADQSTIAGSVFLHRSEFSVVDLHGADIGGNLEVDSGSRVSGTLTADQSTIAGSVFLHRSEFADIRLFGADIGGLIHLDGARWQPGGSLDLQQAHADGIWTDDSFDSLPDMLALSGFTFDQWANPDPGTLGPDWFASTWLGRLDTFSPGPYNQLAAVMDAGGHPTIAADVRYRRSHAERLQIPWTSPDRWGRELHWLVLGYGLRPWWALGWFSAVWSIGYAVFRKDQASRWSKGQAALYSLERLLPTVKLVDSDKVPPWNHAQQVWSIVQMLIGLLLTLLIVGWLGNLVAHT